MNAPVAIDIASAITVDTDVSDAELNAYIDHCADATVFHSLAWCKAVMRATYHIFHPLVARDAGGAVIGYLPLHHIRSPLFGDALVSTAFAVEGGILAEDERTVAALADAAIALATDLNISSIELRGGKLPQGWAIDDSTNVAYARALESSREGQLASMPKRHRAEVRKSIDVQFDFLNCDDSPARQKTLLNIPRKHRAEVRKGIELSLQAAIGSGEVPRRIHYMTYAESVRNLGTPVFPARLFSEVLNAFGHDADTLTIFNNNRPISSVLTLYWRGTAMPYWGGGIAAARGLRANERLYFELMDHARARGMSRLDFGRSKAGSGPAAWKRSWGFEERPLIYARWHESGKPQRDTSAQSPRYAMMVRAWQKLPLWLANLIGPAIARQLG